MIDQEIVRLQPTVQLQFRRLISAKQNTVVHAAITFEKIVMIVIKPVYGTVPEGIMKQSLRLCTHEASENSGFKGFPFDPLSMRYYWCRTN